MGSGYPKGALRDDVFHGPHIGHPILRRRPSGRFYVCIGRLDESDEAWTRSRKLLRAIREVLAEDDRWWDNYKSKGRLAYEKSFVHRPRAELSLNDAVNYADAGADKVRFTALSQYNWSSGQLVERIFPLLVAEGVLRHPTVREMRPVINMSPLSHQVSIDKPLVRTELWMPDQEAADLWLSTRLLLLEEFA